MNQIPLVSSDYRSVVISKKKFTRNVQPGHGTVTFTKDKLCTLILLFRKKINSIENIEIVF